MAERVFSIVTRPETGVELYELIKAHVLALHEQGMNKIVGFDVMSNGRVILFKVRGPSADELPDESTIESVLSDDFVDSLEPLAEELVDGFYVPSFAHCASEEGEADC